MTQEQKDLVNKLMNADTICVEIDKNCRFEDLIIEKIEVYRGKFQITASHKPASRLEIFKVDEPHQIYLQDFEYGYHWAFDAEELRRLRDENRKMQLKEKIAQYQEELKKLEAETNDK